MKKQLAAVAMGAALLGGAGAGAMLAAPTIASADSTSTSSSATTAEGSGTAQAKPGAWADDVFKKLVSDGTITQAQADKVQAALEAARPAGGPGGPGGPGRGGGPGLDAAAKALGIDASELRTDLQSGKTIAAVAKAKGVDVQKVVDALVTDMQSHLAQAVTDGRLTQGQADEMKANATERATAMVNGQRPDGPPPGMGAPGSSGSSSNGSSTSSSTTS